ncbi:MAG: hypothetical protein FWG02_10355 [Holophagaceae bacterium]|nr:hypothetical protein [Holophagaceae bacterium]
MKFPLLSAALTMCFCTGIFAQQQQAPPEYAELRAAIQSLDAPARVKELKRIKAAYPSSTLIFQIDMNLLSALTESADSLEKALADQKEILDEIKLQYKFSAFVNATSMLIGHSKVDDFSGDELLKAVQGYKAKGNELIANPDFMATIPENYREQALNSYKTAFEIPLANAQMKAGNNKVALDILEKYKTTGTLNAGYYTALGEVLFSLERFDGAMNALMSAVTEGNSSALENAKKAYAKVKGSEDGFEVALKALRTQLPFHPPPFKAPENWQGKAVLAELFTGSECPPCVAADFAFDGFIESYPTKYLVILEYHLPIPLYDPMMNPTAIKRQSYYGRNVIGGTPTIVINGVHSIPAGGGRGAALGSFNRLKEGIDPLINHVAEVTITAKATLSGDEVKVDCEFSSVIENADYNVILVQGMEEFEGGNGIIHHKMVVREMTTISPATSATVSFNIPESEKATEDHVTEWSKTINQGIFSGSKWPQINFKIDRKDLKAVVFIQHKESKQVLNAFVADVK